MSSEECEGKLVELEAQILEQEHRIISTFINFFGRSKWPKSDKRRRATIISLLWMFVPRITPTTAGLGAVGLLTIVLAYEANIKLENQNTLITVQNELAEAQRRSSLNIELSEIMNEINKELSEKENIPKPIRPEGFKRGHKLGKFILSNVTSSRIVAISHSFKPYRSLIDTNNLIDKSSVQEIKKLLSLKANNFFTSKYNVDDFLSESYLSPERGQLLIALTKIKIKLEGVGGLGQLSNFHYSDLRSANLRKSDIRSVKIDFSDLGNTNLDYAIFDEASMEGVSLNKARGTHTRFVSSDLFRASFDNSTFPSANFKDAFLVDASFKHADLMQANLSGSNVEGVDFEGVNLEGANLEGILNYKKISSIKGALVLNVQNPPEGFIDWAIKGGAHLDSSLHIEESKRKNPERYYRVFSTEK
jgi:uncharacterized protein YjbI with pentapeptide repeats